MSPKLYKKKLERLAYRSFVNALQFNNDSAVLLMLGSFPAAAFMSAHAQEEMGKFFLIDDLCIDIDDDAKTPEEAENYLQKNIMRDHVLKQFFFGISVGKISQFEKYVNNPRTIQELRNQSLYTTYDTKTGRAGYPSKGVTVSKALYQIRFVNGALMELLHYAYVKQHNGKVDDESFGLENNTVMNDFYMVDEACARMHYYKNGDKIEVDRELLEYFELVKNNTQEQEKQLKASFKLYLACRRYQGHRKVRRFVKY